MASRKAGTEAASQDLHVSVVVPVYRNAETLPELYRRLRRTLEVQQLSFEMLFVDDACPVGSLAVLESLARSDSRVTVLALAENVGQHRAVLAGLAYARGDWAVVMDADLQDPPEAIPPLLAKGQEGFAAVFAGRRGWYESPMRLLTSRVSKGLLHLLTGIPADAGIFVAMNRVMVTRLLTLGGPHPMIVAMIGCAGLPMVSIPVVRARRPTGSSAYNSWGRLKSGWRAIAWVLDWKWRTLHHLSSRGMDLPPIKAYLGARFTSKESKCEPFISATP
jgi:glycosyltransferase involved in cell wall biosynthesis